jgi:uncharacterized lipoprotein YmbA
MRVTPFSCGLPVILALVVIFSGGCTRSQTPRFYTLTSMQPDQVPSERGSPAHSPVIGIGPVTIADYLDQSDLVTRTGDNQLVKAEYDRWAGSFKDDFVNVLAENIGFMVPTERIYLYPWRGSVTIGYQVALEVIRCDGRLGEAAHLVARWRVFEGPEKKLIKMNRSSIREPVTGPGYAALVAAQSRAVARLSQEIAGAIRAVAKH